MEKHQAKEWVVTLEKFADNKLTKWRKENGIENGEAIQLHWQFEQTHIILNIFWEDNKEAVRFQYHSPRVNQHFDWSGLTDKTFNKVMDRVGNLAQITMNPIIDPEIEK